MFLSAKEKIEPFWGGTGASFLTFFEGAERNTGLGRKPRREIVRVARSAHELVRDIEKGGQVGKTLSPVLLSVKDVLPK